nr:hypothetical protein [Tanacetum cinerariifolium]
MPPKLDLDELNYSSWRYFFTIHYNNFNVLKHIEPKTDDASTSTPPTEEWLTADSIVKSWIILTLSPSLQKWFIKINLTTARDAWERVKKLFQDNKRTRMVALKGELRMLHMGDQSADEYCSKIDSLVTLLSDLGSDDPFPDLATMRSMVSTEEMRPQSKSPIQPTNMTASAPHCFLLLPTYHVGVTIAIPAIVTIANPTQALRISGPVKLYSDVISRVISIRSHLHLILNPFCSADGDPVSDPTLYRSLAWATRPDISYAVQQYADIFTKRLPTALFDEFRSSLSVRSFLAQTAGGC